MIKLFKRFRVARAVHHSTQQWFLAWLQGWAGLVDSLITILSLNLVITNFEISVCWWRTALYFKEIKRQREKEKAPNNA